jgi:hypothetical protein
MISHFPQCEDIDLFIAEASVTNFTNKNNALLGFFGGELCNRAAEFVPETAIFAVWSEPPRRRRVSGENAHPSWLPGGQDPWLYPLGSAAAVLRKWLMTSPLLTA